MCYASRRRLLLQLGCSLGSQQPNAAAFEFLCACKHRYVTDAKDAHRTGCGIGTLLPSTVAFYCTPGMLCRRQASPRVRRMRSRRAAEGCVDADSIRLSVASARKTLAKRASRGQLVPSTPVLLSVAESSHHLVSLIRSAVGLKPRSLRVHRRPHSTLVTGAHTPSRRATMLSQFFVLSPRGDTIISKDYRGDSPPGAAEAFFRKCREERSCPPCFRINDVTYVWVKQHGLMFVCNTRFNASPSTIIELLNRLVKVFKDYCGVLSEEAIRKNFILIYELLDEIVDFGYPQGTSTENLKACVYNEPLLVDAQKMRVPSLSTKTVSSSAVHKPIGSRKTGMMGQSGAARNEIFVDILERLTMLFAANGSVVNSTIDGCIQMKSYLAGNPELRLALNEDLVVGKGGPYGTV